MTPPLSVKLQQPVSALHDTRHLQASTPGSVCVCLCLCVFFLERTKQELKTARLALFCHFKTCVVFESRYLCLQTLHLKQGELAENISKVYKFKPFAFKA